MSLFAMAGMDKYGDGKHPQLQMVVICIAVIKPLNGRDRAMR
jgi:hypothetical protein